MIRHSGIKITIIILLAFVVNILFTLPISAATNGFSEHQFLPSMFYTQSDVRGLIKIHSDSTGLPRHDVVWKTPQGTTTTCNPMGGQCATTFEYAPNGVVIGSTWEFLISGQQRTPGAYTAIVNYCTSLIGNTCVVWAEAFRTTFIIAPDPEAPVIATVPVGNHARAVGVNPATNRVYAANYGSNTVSVIDGESDTLVTTVTLGSDASPMSIGVNPSTNRVYVANFGDNSVSVIDGESDTLVTTVPLGSESSPMSVGVNPATNRIYVANVGGNAITVIDGENNTIVATVTVGSDSYLFGIGINPATNRIYVADYGGDTISVIDGESNTVVATVTVGSKPRAIAVNPATNRVYVANHGSNTVSVINGTSNAVVATVPLDSDLYLYGIDVNPTTNHIYVASSVRSWLANWGEDNVSVIDGASNTVIAAVALGRPAEGVAINPTTNRVYVANQDGNSVTVIQDEGTSQTAVYVPIVMRATP